MFLIVHLENTMFSKSLYTSALLKSGLIVAIRSHKAIEEWAYPPSYRANDFVCLIF